MMPRKSTFLIFLGVVLLTVYVYAQYGNQGSLTKAEALYIYMGQQLLNGVLPYDSALDAKTPLSSFATALGIGLGRLAGWDDIQSARSFFLMISAFAAAISYVLGKTLSRTHTVGVLAAATFLLFTGFGINAYSGPLSKTLLVMLQGLALYSLVRKEWFWAGLTGSLAFLTWQPGLLYAGLAIGLPIFQSAGSAERRRSILAGLAGFAIPSVSMVLLYAAAGQLQHFIESAFVFNLKYLVRHDPEFPHQILHVVDRTLAGYRLAAVPIAISIVALLVLFFRRWQEQGGLWDTLVRDRYSAILLSFIVLIGWSYYDYQNWPDTYPLLIYFALGFGYFLGLGVQLVSEDNSNFWVRPASVMLIVLTIASVSVLEYRDSPGRGLPRQIRLSQQIEELIPDGGTVLVLGRPAFLAITGRTSITRHVFLLNGFDRQLDATLDGGFKAFAEKWEHVGPDVIVVGQVRGCRPRQWLNDWLTKEYIERKTLPMRGWKVYTRAVGSWVTDGGTSGLFRNAFREYSV